MAHTFDPANADALDDVSRYRYCSRDELVDFLDPSPAAAVVDLGSGTGFYTDDVAPYAGAVYGVDVQPTMHDLYCEDGVPENVRLVTAEVADLPFGTGTVDGAFSTMTFHEFATPGALAEVARALRPGARFVTVDWSAEGEGEAGPPRGDCHSVETARPLVEDAGFEVVYAAERPETFVVVATL